MPLDVGLGSLESGRLERKVGLFRAAAAEAGRDDVPITMFAFGDPTPETLRCYADLGIERTVVGVSRAGEEDSATTMPFIDRYAELIPDLA